MPKIFFQNVKSPGLYVAKKWCLGTKNPICSFYFALNIMDYDNMVVCVPSKNTTLL